MKAAAQGDTYVLALEIGEELFESILRYSVQEKIPAASISAIGAIKNFELGYYVLDRKEYLRKRFDGIAELISCQGNLATREAKPFLHLHASAGFSDFSVAGGHLFSAIVAVTVEIVIHPLPAEMNRSFDERSGLYLLDLLPCKAF